jgi:hypothetical protein
VIMLFYNPFAPVITIRNVANTKIMYMDLISPPFPELPPASFIRFFPAWW